MIYTEAQKQLAIIGDRIVDNIKDAIKKSGKFNTGRLYNSINVKMDIGGLRINIDSPYYQFVLNGRRAGSKRPPIKAILSWLDTPHGKSYYTKLNLKKKPEQSISKLTAAFMVANTIKKRGIPPMKKKNLINLTLSIKKEQGFKDLEDAYRRDVEAELKKTFAFLK